MSLQEREPRELHYVDPVTGELTASGKFEHVVPPQQATVFINGVGSLPAFDADGNAIYVDDEKAAIGRLPHEVDAVAGKAESALTIANEANVKADQALGNNPNN